MLIKFRGAVYQRVRRAQDDAVPESELVETFEDSPAANWEDYLQPIIRALKVQLGDTKVSLLGPTMKARPGGPGLSGFDIVGHIGFPDGRPIEVLDKFGDGPVPFSAHILPSGDLAKNIQIGAK